MTDLTEKERKERKERKKGKQKSIETYIKYFAHASDNQSIFSFGFLYTFLRILRYNI